MLKKISINIVMLSISLLFFSGCGGGGDAEENKPKKEVVIVPPTLNVSIGDIPDFLDGMSYSVDMNVTYNGNNTIQYNFTSSENIVVSVENEQLNIIVNEIESIEDSYNFSVSVSAGNLSQNFDYEGVIKNTSLIEAYELAKVMVGESEKYKDSMGLEVITVHSYLAEQSYLMGNINKEKKIENINIVKNEVSLFINSIDSIFQSLNELVIRYENQDINEFDANLYMSDYKDALDNFSEGILKLNSIYDTDNMYGLVLPIIKSFNINNKASFFEGDDELGEFVENEWVYFDDYKYLSMLIGENKINCTEEG